MQEDSLKEETVGAHLSSLDACSLKFCSTPFKSPQLHIQIPEKPEKVEECFIKMFATFPPISMYA